MSLPLIVVLSVVAAVVLVIGVFVVFGGISDGITRDYSREVADRMGLRIGPLNALIGERQGCTVRLIPKPGQPLEVEVLTPPGPNHRIWLLPAGSDPPPPIDGVPPTLREALGDTLDVYTAPPSHGLYAGIVHRLEALGLREGTINWPEPGARATMLAELQAYSPEDLEILLATLIHEAHG